MTIQDHEAARRRVDEVLGDPPGEPGSISRSRASSRPRWPASARARSSAAGSSATRARGGDDRAGPDRRPGGDEHRVGADPGLVEVQLQGPRTVPDRKRQADDVAPSDVARWGGHRSGRAPVRARQRARQGHVRDDDARRADQPGRHPRAGHRRDDDRRRHRVAVRLLRQDDRRRADALHRRDHRRPAARDHRRRRLRPRVVGHVAGGPGARPVHLDGTGPAGAGRVPRPARAGVRRRRACRQRAGSADHLQAHPAQHRRHDRRQCRHC